MRRIRNADEFSIELHRIRIDYEQQYQSSITAIRGRYATMAGEPLPAVDSLLEAHERQYLINHFLHALNWQFDMRSQGSLPNLVPEAPVHSIAEETTRFLDYLGLDEAMTKALLIVETKRRSSRLPLPKKNRSGQPPRGASFESIIADFLSGNAELTEEWQEWLQTLRDYSQSIKDKSGYSPRRVFTTNGDWLILFLDPEDAFGSALPSQNRIRVYQTWAEIEENSREIFDYLEYHNVLGKTPSLSLGEIGFYLASEQVDRAMFGLRLLYMEEPDFYLDSLPFIKVVPVVFIRSKSGIWFRVETQNSNHTQRIPSKVEYLQEHIETFAHFAAELLDAVNMKLGANLTCSSLSEHYADPNLFDELTPVTKIPSKHEEFLIVTGNSTHYLLNEATIATCPYHSWDSSEAEGLAAGKHPIKRAQVSNPRTILVADTKHHCSHKDVMNAKSCCITNENRERCGARSSEIQGAFCEIWKFEQHLCCRTCAFEEVCTKARVFQLPCQLFQH